MDALRQLTVWVHGKTKEVLTNCKPVADLGSVPLLPPLTAFQGTSFPFPTGVFSTTMATFTANSNCALPRFSTNKGPVLERNLSLALLPTLCTISSTTPENFSDPKSTEISNQMPMSVPVLSPTLNGSSVNITETEPTDQSTSASAFSTPHGGMMKTLDVILYAQPCSTKARILELVLHEVVNFFNLRKEKGNYHSLRWDIVKMLRSNHYDVGLCKAITTNVGQQEYIDVLMSQQRYIVDTEFKDRFQIARPTPDYLELFQKLPAVFVGSIHEITIVVQIMCRAIEISMESIGLQSPPHYREFNYVMATWTAPYKRKIVPPPGFGGAETPPSDWMEKEQLLLRERELLMQESQNNFKIIRGFNIPSNSRK